MSNQEATDKHTPLYRRHGSQADVYRKETVRMRTVRPPPATIPAFIPVKLTNLPPSIKREEEED